MKNYTVTLRFFGLTGEYTTQEDVRAKHAASAKKKASRVIGNRDGYVVSVCEKPTPEPIFKVTGDGPAELKRLLSGAF